jgi:uncharacterized protein (TIGR00290 family)
MKVAVSWTGGKDSALACYKAQKKHEIVVFANFIWEKPSLSHPIDITRTQAKVLRKQFLWDKLQPPYFESYREAIIELKNEYGIEAIVTGDIAADDFHGAWIDEVCKDTGVQVIKPLWKEDRRTALNELLTAGFKVVFTCVKEPWLTEEWMGKTIDDQRIKEMQNLHEINGLDVCGEFGEYHTMVMDAPYFDKVIDLSSFRKEKTENGFIMKDVSLSIKPKP